MAAHRKKSIIKRIFLVSIIIFIAIGIGFGIYVSNYYHADNSVQESLTSDEKVTVTHSGNHYVMSTATSSTGFIFYPGGKVEATAYAPLLHKLAENDIFCVLVEMPCNLAILNSNAAEEIIKDYPKITSWYIGGHSLGGVMAASFASSHQKEIDGLVLLASYSTADFSQSDIRVFSAYGSEDGVLNLEKYNEARKNLPSDFTEFILQGGCHAGFGSYGAQKGDGTPTLSSDEQQSQTVEALLSWFKEAA